MLILDMQPASIVEDLGFRRLVSMLDPRYDIPSKRTLMRRLPIKYQEIKLHILKVLPQVKYVYASLTTDTWTSGTIIQKAFHYNYVFHSFVGAEKLDSCHVGSSLVLNISQSKLQLSLK